MTPVDLWAPLTVEPHSCTRWTAGPVSLWVARGPGEWRIGSVLGPDPLATEYDVEHGVELPEDLQTIRFAAAGADTLRLAPLLADRSVVARPETTLCVTDTAVLFVTTPMWVEICLTSGTRLTEIPTWRPSDTWFGPAPTTGVLAYASRTRGRTTPGQLVISPVRAITRIEIRDDAPTPLAIERINLPVPELALYSDKGRLWTTSLRLHRRSDGDSADLQLVPGPPTDCPDATPVARPRIAAPTGLRRALSALIG